MKNKKIKLSVLLLGFGITAQAQQSTNATGGDASGSGGTVAYSLGQVAYTTSTHVTGTVCEGVQQTYDIATVGIRETELNISLSVFPNPTVDNLTLQISNYNNEKLSYQLYDVGGKLLNIGKIVSQQTYINTATLPPATYFINVVNQDNKVVQSFKILKN